MALSTALFDRKGAFVCIFASPAGACVPVSYLGRVPKNQLAD